LQIATSGVGPATIEATALRGFPQNEQRIGSTDRLGPVGSSDIRGVSALAQRPTQL